MVQEEASRERVAEKIKSLLIEEMKIYSSDSKEQFCFAMSIIADLATGLIFSAIAKKENQMMVAKDIFDGIMNYIQKGTFDD